MYKYTNSSFSSYSLPPPRVSGASNHTASFTKPYLRAWRGCRLWACTAPSRPNALLRGTTRQPSTCGCSLRVRSGLLPLEDYASNLVGAVRSKMGPLGRRRPFRAVRHFGRKWATCTPSTLQRDYSDTRGRVGQARLARRRHKERARRVLRRGCKYST